MVAINTNIASLLAQNNSRIVNNELEKAMERLSSGLRINSAGDDAAGLAIASRMEAQVRGLQMAKTLMTGFLLRKWLRERWTKLAIYYTE